MKSKAIIEELPLEHHVRPRFKVEISVSLGELCNRVTDKLAEKEACCEGYLKHGFGTIALPTADQHYWSPQLTLTVEELEGKTILRGLYAPRPAVWTMFVFFYSFIGFLILVVTIMGLSFYSLDKPATILWAIPLLFLILGSLYFVSRKGQEKGKDQLLTLHHFIEGCVEQKITS